MSNSATLGFSAEDYSYCTLLIAETTVFVGADEPSRFLHQWGGKILTTLDSPESSIPIGTFKVMVADIEGAICEDVSPHDVFDSEASSFSYYEALYEGDSDIKENVLRIACGTEFIWRPNLLMLDRLVIFPEHRGHNVGLLALHTLMEQFRVGTGLIAMKPFPLQFEPGHGDEADLKERSALGLDRFHCNAKTATAKLKKHYSQLGFKSVPKTEYMVRNPETPLPDVDSLTRSALALV